MGCRVKVRVENCWRWRRAQVGAVQRRELRPWFDWKSMAAGCGTAAHFLQGAFLLLIMPSTAACTACRFYGSTFLRNCCTFLQCALLFLVIIDVSANATLCISRRCCRGPAPLGSDM